MDTNQNCHCPCGETQFNIVGEPLFRVFCHCTICQAFTEGPYSDATVFLDKNVIKPGEKCLRYKKIWIPPFYLRDKCATCNKPAIEYLHMLPMPRLTIVPSANIYDKSFVPDPSLHIFYDKRVVDIEDDLPKYSGYLRSQLAVMRMLLASMAHGN